MAERQFCKLCDEVTNCDNCEHTSETDDGKGSLHLSQVAYQDGAYPYVKQLGIFPLRPGWYPSVLPPALCSLLPIYTPGGREVL